MGPSVHRVYDLVTWDPRGVPFSQPKLSCSSSEPAIRAALLRPRALLADREIAANLDATQQVATGCGRDPITRFVTTIDNVRDLDRLRQAVRDPKLSYVGISYGTVIGAVYANVFPGRYRALALHGLVDSVTWFDPSFAFSIDDAVQLQKALDAGLQACDAAPAVCALAPHAPKKYAQLLATVRAHTVASQQSTYFSLLSIISREFLNVGEPARQAAQLLQAFYSEVVVHHTAVSPQLMALARKPVPLDTWGTGLSEDVWAATVCSDAGQMPQTLDPWIRAAHVADRVAPVFGVESALERAVCASWNAFGDRYTGPWNRGRAPILLLNQRWDPATPLSWAQTMTRELNRAHLITISGWGHGIETPCSRRAVDGYLLTGRLPSTSYCRDGLSLFTISGLLRIELSASRRSLTVGHRTTLTVHVTNRRHFTLQHVRTCLSLPAGLIYQRSRPAATLTNRSWCWTAAALAAGHARNYTLTAEASGHPKSNLTVLANTTASHAYVSHARLAIHLTSSAAPPRYTG